MNTQIREAFLNAQVKAQFWKTKLGHSITRAIAHDAGVKPMGKGYNCHLSFRTAQSLKSMGYPI